MSQGLTGAVSGASARLGNTASTASMTLPAGPLVATYPITGTTPITSITAGQSGKIALLEFASANCRVVSGSNLLLNGDYLSTPGSLLTLVSTGSNWEEVTRSAAFIQPYNSVPNGDFVGWARPFTTGSTFTSIASGTYFADRWIWGKVGTGVVDIVRDTSVPAIAYNAIGTPYSMKINVTTADTTIGAGDQYTCYTISEGYDTRSLANGFAVSFWVKAHRTGIYCVSFANGTLDHSYIIEYTIAVADTWQYVTAVIPAPTGTWDYGAGKGMYCVFSLAMGSISGSGTANTWASSISYSTTNQVNGVGATSDTFSLWGLNVIPGTVPQPLVPIPSALQLVRLQRYCQVFGGQSLFEVFGTGKCWTATRSLVFIPFAVQMLSIPTVTINTASNFAIMDAAGSNVACTALSAVGSRQSTRGLDLDCTVASGLVAGDGAYLYANNTLNPRIICEANP